jgi:hypothetical protein
MPRTPADCAQVLGDGHTEYWGNNYVYDACYNLRFALPLRGFRRSVANIPRRPVMQQTLKNRASQRCSRLTGQEQTLAGRQRPLDMGLRQGQTGTNIHQR